MPYPGDSLDKVFNHYIAPVARVPFVFEGKTFEPRPLVVSTGIFRGYTCPEGCGACCQKYTLIWLPHETPPYDVEEHWVEVNGVLRRVLWDTQQDNDGFYCRNLNHENGRCMVHNYHTLSCDFELLRVTLQSERSLLNQRLYGRGWNMLRVVDNTRGAMCEMTPPSPEAIADTVRRLRRLQEWTKYFRIRSWLPVIIRWVASGPHDQPLRLNPRTIGVVPVEAEDAG